jgi:hypothetical protein
LGSKPNGDAGNPRLVYWIRRQESDLRGLRSERSWDASNPHLNNWRASKELHPTSGLWRPVPRYEDRPKLAERGEPESHAARRTVCFPDSPRTLPGSRSKMAEGGRSRSTHPRGCHSFSKRGCAPAHFTFQCWQRLSESNAHDPRGSSSGSSRLSTPHASLQVGGERTTRRPCRSRHPSVSNRVQDPACFTLRNWSPAEDLHLTSPAYKAGAPLSVRDGQMVGRAGIAPASRRLKGGSLSR